MKPDQTKYCLLFSIAVIAFAACEGTLNQRVEKITNTINKIDSATVKVSKGVSGFSDAVEGYVDTTAYKKDSNGIWQKKAGEPETKELN